MRLQRRSGACLINYESSSINARASEATNTIGYTDYYYALFAFAARSFS